VGVVCVCVLSVCIRACVHVCARVCVCVYVHVHACVYVTCAEAHQGNNMIAMQIQTLISYVPSTA
jgi:hypothetical protein